MKKQLLTFSLVVGLCLLVKSCIEDGDLDFSDLGIADNFTYDLPFPLVDTRLTLGELLKNIQGQYVIADADGLLKLVYREEFSLEFCDLGVFIPDLLTFENLPVISVPAGDDNVLFSTDSIRHPNTLWKQLVTEEGVRIDSARTQKMDFQFRIVTGVRNRVRFEMTTPNVVDASGRPFSISQVLPGVQVGSQQVSMNLDLSHYTIIPDHSQPEKPHALRIDYTITVFRDTLVTTPYSAATFLEVFFRNIEIDYAHGYLGQQIFGPISSGIDLPIFDRFPMDLLEIERANMNLVVTNGVGIPIQLDAEISTLTHNPDNPIKTLTLNDRRLDYPLNLLAPPITTTFEEEIQDLINDNLGQLPYRMEYSVTITTNPDNNPTTRNFISKNSFIKTVIGAEIPMRLRVGGLVVSDTIAFAGLPFSDGIEFFTIRANLHNAFPLDASIFLYLLDDQYQVIDSIWAIRRPNETEKRPLEIQGAPVNPVTGHVIRPTIAQLEIPLEREQIESLVNTRYFKIKGVLNTSEHEENMINIFENSDTEGFLRVMIGCRIRASGKLISSFSDLLDGIRDQ